MPTTTYTIRRATPCDGEIIGRMGAGLLCLHHDYDRHRFMAPGADAEGGYGRFLVSQLLNPDALVCVAEQSGTIVGYVYAGIEPMSWKELRDEAGFVHDLWVDEDARGGGIATALLTEAVRWLESRGMPRVILWTAAGNAAGQRLFARLGFRPTMIEMTREAGTPAAADAGATTRHADKLSPSVLRQV